MKRRMLFVPVIVLALLVSTSELAAAGKKQGQPTTPRGKTERSITNNKQQKAVQKIVNAWCKKNHFDVNKVKLVSVDSDSNFVQGPQGSWGYSNSGVIYIPYDKENITTVLEKTLDHEYGHTVLWNAASVLSNSVFSEMYAMYLSDGGVQVADDRKTAALNFQKIFKAYCDKNGLGDKATAKDAEACAIWCAKKLAKNNPTWEEGQFATNIANAAKITDALVNAITADQQQQGTGNLEYSLPVQAPGESQIRPRRTVKPVTLAPIKISR